MHEEKKLNKDAVLSPDYTEKDIMLDRQLSIICHVLGLLTNIFGPLVFVLTKEKDAKFMRHNEIEAFNFQFTVLLATIIAALIDIYVIDNFIIVPVVGIINFYSVVTAVVKTKQDIFFYYPISIRIIPHKKENNPVEEDEKKDKTD